MTYQSSGWGQINPNGIKRQAFEDSQGQKPTKKVKLLLGEDDSSDEERGIAMDEGGKFQDHQPDIKSDGFTVNEEFARRFEHNKKREELHRLEEKYGDPSVTSKSGRRPGSDENGVEGSESSTDSEEEDEEGILASGALNTQIQNTLEAIINKDPRVYDDKVKFYTDPIEEVYPVLKSNGKKEKPMSLSDYHRRNLLETDRPDEVADMKPKTYAQQQDSLKDELVKEMHAATTGDTGLGSGESEKTDSDDEFLVRKSSTRIANPRPTHGKSMEEGINVENADRDPETYLSNFISARGWIASDGARLQPFESDDEEEERRADLFEEAYNLRFEDPKASNEKLLSHARDTAAKYSVRKEPMNPRKKARDAERTKKEAAKQIRTEEKAQLRKLKVADAEEKLRKIREAAGLTDKSLEQEDWSAFLEDGWDDARWEQEMRKRFGDDYYADHDPNTDSGKRKIKKPKWEDDVDINDLVPEFVAEGNARPQFELTEDESDGGGAPIPDHEFTSQDYIPAPKTKKIKKDRHKNEEKKMARQDRRKIERLIDQQMDVDETMSNFSKKHAGQFRYRDTSPTAFGLTAHEILLASDSQLNQYAGLKKMAAFRDSDKKKRDKKHLGKKARLRQWRKDTFGNEQGPQLTLTEDIAGDELAQNESKSSKDTGLNVKEGKRKTRSKKHKASGNG